jgi:hypothetical protein
MDGLGWYGTAKGAGTAKSGIVNKSPTSRRPQPAISDEFVLSHLPQIVLFQYFNTGKPHSDVHIRVCLTAQANVRWTATSLPSSW